MPAHCPKGSRRIPHPLLVEIPPSTGPRLQPCQCPAQGPQAVFSLQQLSSLPPCRPPPPSALHTVSRHRCPPPPLETQPATARPPPPQSLFRVPAAHPSLGSFVSQSLPLWKTRSIYSRAAPPESTRPQHLTEIDDLNSNTTASETICIRTGTERAWIIGLPRKRTWWTGKDLSASLRLHQHDNHEPSPSSTPSRMLATSTKR